MNLESKEKMEMWLGRFPESSHPLDEERFFDFVVSLCRAKETVSKEEMAEFYSSIHPDFEEEHILTVCDKWDSKISNLQSFYKFLNE